MLKAIKTSISLKKKDKNSSYCSCIWLQPYGIVLYHVTSEVSGSAPVEGYRHTIQHCVQYNIVVNGNNRRR